MAGLPIKQLGALAAQIAFDLVGGPAGAVEAVTFHLGQGGGTYDAGSDSYTSTGGSDVPQDVIAYTRKNIQTGAGLQSPATTFTADTETLLVQRSKLPEGAVINERDTVTRADGVRWEIVKVSPDPSGATFSVDVRK